MTPADHLIERAAALLQGSVRQAPPPGSLTPGLDQDGAASRPPLPARDPPPLPVFVPLPPAQAAQVQAEAAPLQANAGPVHVGQIHARQAHAGVLTEAAPPRTHSPVPDPAPALLIAEPIGTAALQAAGLVVSRSGRTRISEEYRIVLGRVLRALREEPDGHTAPNLLMVTSAKPGEGKSFTSLNLAGSVAQHTADKVLLVDLDAKLQPLTALLGVAGDRGFYDVVADAALDLRSVVRNTAFPNLKFMPVGHRSGDADIGGEMRPISTVINRIASLYSDHVVILDAPPCLSTSDPSTLAPIVSQIVMVIEAERTQRSEVEAALDLVRVCPTITMLLNKVQLTTNHTFGAYDYYGNYS